MMTTSVVRLGVAILIAGACMAQTEKAQLSGTITDNTTAVVPAARVIVTNAATGIKRAVDSDETGHYLVPLLDPGTYDMTVRKEGFRSVSRTGIKLDVAQTAMLNFSLEVGAVTESIDVTATAPLLDTGTNAIGQVVDTHSVENLPANGRNSHLFMMLTPGVRAPSGFRTTQFDNYNSQFVSINGARPNQNVFYIDGGNNSTSNFNGPAFTPSVDIVEEFKVQTNNFSAEYTSAAGGVVNLVTKTGTNQFHGSAYEYLRNDKLAATDFFVNRAGLTKTPFRFNQFGVTVGGPVIRNRTFFFAGYEGVRNMQGNTYSNTLPTALQKTGDFSGTFNRSGQLMTIYDPLTTRPDPAAPGRYLRSAFPDNRIPDSRIDPASRKLLSFFPQPNAAGEPLTGNNNFVSNAAAPKNKDDVSGRLDHQVSDATRLFGRFSYDTTYNGTPHVYDNAGSIEIGVTKFLRYSAVINATHTFSPTLLLDASSSFNRWHQERQGPGVGFNSADVGLPAYIGAASAGLAFPQITVSGMQGSSSVGNTYQATSLGGAQVSRHGYDRFEQRATLTKIRGAHTLRLGILYGVSRQNAETPGALGGAYTFNQAFTQGPDPLRTSANAGVGFATFLLGDISGGSHDTIQIGMAVLNPYWGGFFQDDIRLSRKLTVNLGLRYDYFAPWAERYNHVSNFDSAGTATLANGVAVRGGLAFPATGNLPRGIWPKDTNNFAPRFGFAYSLNEKTVLRGGYGLFYTQLNGGGYNANAIPNSGFNCSTLITTTLDGGLTPNARLSNPFPGGMCKPTGSSLGLLTQLGQTVYYADRTARTPYSQQWSFDVQRGLPGDMLVDLAYSGNHGVALLGILDQNQMPAQHMQLGQQLLRTMPNPYFGVIPTGPLSTPTTTQNQLLRPYPQLLNVISTSSTYGSSIYHALQAKFQKRFSRGFTLLASYTFSKLIDDIPPTTTGFPGESFAGGGLQNFQDRRQERALAVYDTPQNFVLSYVWELPFGKGRALLNRGGILDRIAGGWQINGITTLQSGPPLQIAGGNANYTSAGTQRPNWSGKNANLSGPISDRLGRYFDTGAFYANDLFRFGNAPRLMPDLRAPGARNFDVSFFKGFTLREAMRLQFRAEFFNIFNSPQFGPPASNFSVGTFGVIGSQINAPRDIQFALKLLF